MVNIVVYGLGNLGREIAKELLALEARSDFHIITFMDKQDLNNQFEFEVKKPECLKELEYDYILITSEKWFAKIREELINEYGVNGNKIIHLNELIKEGSYYCNLCEKEIPFMLDAGIDSPIFSKRKIIGGGKRKKCICPLCGCNDRERWVQYVLKNEIHIYDEEAKILHFAPERQIEKKLRNNKKLEYITADIEKGRADRVEDITNISFQESSFDYIICNHIMEHISNEKGAFAELRRCLKKTGKIVFSVPICWETDTIEDDTIVTKEERLKEYGQEDHVRLYGRDLQKKLEENGFHAMNYQVNKILSQEKIEVMRLIPEDSVWILTI